MKCIVAGSRGITDYNLLIQAFTLCPFSDSIKEIVSGRAKGVDTLGERFAEDNNITLSKFPANWKKFGTRAGPLRNIEMGNYADCLIAIMSYPKTTGTTHMIEYMMSLKKPIFRLIVNGESVNYRSYNV